MSSPVTTADQLFRFQAVMLPWAVRGAHTLAQLVTDASTLPRTAWHDGDTFCALVDKGTRGFELFHVRCAGYDAPELTGATKPAGLASLAYAQSLAETGAVVLLDSVAFEATDEEDNFGRMLAYVTLPDGRPLADVMIAAGQAVPDPS